MHGFACVLVHLVLGVGFLRDVFSERVHQHDRKIHVYVAKAPHRGTFKFKEPVIRYVCISRTSNPTAGYGLEGSKSNKISLTVHLAGWPRSRSGSAAAWPLFFGPGCQGSTPGSPAAESCTAAPWSPDPGSASSCHSELLPQNFVGPEHNARDAAS